MHDYIVNGSNSVYTFLGIFAIFYSLLALYQTWADYEKKADFHGWLFLLPARRIFFGLVLIVCGYVSRIGGWIPWRSIRVEGDLVLSAWWANVVAPVFNIIGLIFVTVGLTYMLYSKRNNRNLTRAAFISLSIVCLLFIFGVYLTDFIILFL